MSTTQVHKLHAGIAESGKLLALKGQHRQALARYREALRLAQSARAPQIFARHYLHCVLESLEHLGAHAEVAALAGEAACAAACPDPSPFQRRDRAHLLERQGVNLLKDGKPAQAREVLTEALAMDASLPLARQLLDWSSRGFAINAARITEAQRRHGYFTVRSDTVSSERAIDPPAFMAMHTREAPHG